MTGQAIRIFVAGTIDSTAALTPSTGDKLFLAINDNLKKQTITEVDFQSIEYITSAFLNAAIGQLYAYYQSDYLRNYLTIINLQKEDAVLLAKVIERAKEYFQDKDRVSSAISHVLND